MSNKEPSLINYGNDITFGKSNQECQSKGREKICKEPGNPIGSCCIGDCDTRNGKNTGFCKIQTYESFVEGFTGEFFQNCGSWKLISLGFIVLSIILIISIIILNNKLKKYNN